MKIVNFPFMNFLSFEDFITLLVDVGENPQHRFMNGDGGAL